MKLIKTIAFFLALFITFFISVILTSIISLVIVKISIWAYFFTVLAVIVHIYAVKRGNKSKLSKGIIISAEIGFLSPVIALLLSILSFIIMPVFTSNAWAVLTCNGYYIPKESSIFTFRDTLNNAELGGNGEYWLYGEDNENYYAMKSYSPELYLRLKKGNEPQGFDKHDSRTWGLEDAKEE